MDHIKQKMIVSGENTKNYRIYILTNFINIYLKIFFICKIFSTILIFYLFIHNFYTTKNFKNFYISIIKLKTNLDQSNQETNERQLKQSDSTSAVVTWQLEEVCVI
uniref:Transmembrane protein n=1 Tax=Brugia timori TaxID=42155 RepID=A0A0R3RCN7_9BILA